MSNDGEREREGGGTWEGIESYSVSNGKGLNGQNLLNIQRKNYWTVKDLDPFSPPLDCSLSTVTTDLM